MAANAPAPSFLARCCLQITALKCDAAAYCCDIGVWCMQKAINNTATSEQALACGCCSLECVSCIAYCLGKAPIENAIGPCCCCILVEIDAAYDGKCFRCCAGCAQWCAAMMAAACRACAQRLRAWAQRPTVQVME